MALAAATAMLFAAGCGGGSTKTSASQEATPQGTQASKTSTTPTTTTTTTASTQTTGATPPPTHTTQQAPPNERIVLSSPAVSSSGLQSRYTCDGQDVPLPLRWKGVPPGTAELMIDVIKVKPVANKLYFSWAVTHISPTTHEIREGKLPPGAVVGTNGDGQAAYHLCPPKGQVESYVAVIFALPHVLRARPGFDPAKLRLQAEHMATYQNLLIFNYTRH